MTNAENNLNGCDPRESDCTINLGSPGHTDVVLPKDPGSMNTDFDIASLLPKNHFFDSGLPGQHMAINRAVLRQFLMD